MSLPVALNNPRVLLAAALAVAALVIGAVVLVAGGSEDADDKPLRTTRAQLTLERGVQPDTGYPELVVSLPEQRLNTTATTGGATSVLLRCVDKRGDEAIRQKHGWPLQEEVGFSPHVHQPVGPKVLKSLRACRMTGTGVDFNVRVRGEIPSIGSAGAEG